MKKTSPEFAFRDPSLAEIRRMMVPDVLKKIEPYNPLLRIRRLSGANNNYELEVHHEKASSRLPDELLQTLANCGIHVVRRMLRKELTEARIVRGRLVSAGGQR